MRCHGKSTCNLCCCVRNLTSDWLGWLATFHTSFIEGPQLEFRCFQHMGNLIHILIVTCTAAGCRSGTATKSVSITGRFIYWRAARDAADLLTWSFITLFNYRLATHRHHRLSWNFNWILFICDPQYVICAPQFQRTCHYLKELHMRLGVHIKHFN